MFWDAVQTTFVVLTYWQVYAAGLEYVIIILTPVLITYLVGRRYGSGGFVKHTSVILVPVFQAVGTLFFVYSVALIALGQEQYSTWKIPFEIALGSPGEFLKLSFYVVLASFVFAFLPFINRFYALQTLALSGLALGMLFVLADGDGFPHFSEIDWLPNFWFVIGIVVVGAIFGTISVTLVSILHRFLSNLTGHNMEVIGLLISVPIASTFGFVPFFIYAAWIGAQIG
jgi:hypothetical protein